jgi:hypothetical protein
LPGVRALPVGDDPEVGGDAGVVEELVGQGDDGFEPVVLDDPAADLGLAGAGRAGEQRRAVEHDGQAGAALLDGGFILEIMCWRNSSEPSLMRGSPAPKRPAKPLESWLVLDGVGHLLPLDAEGRVGEEVVEGLADEPSWLKRVAVGDVGGVLALQHHVGAADGVGLGVELLAEHLQVGVRVQLARRSSATDSIPPVPQAGSNRVRTTTGLGQQVGRPR